MMTRARGVVAVLATALLLASPARADDELDVGVSDSTLEIDGRTELIVTVDGSDLPDEGLPAEAFTVSENGQDIEGIRVAPLLEEQDEAPPRTGVIVFDISGSARGEPLEAAKRGAISLVETIVPRGASVGLVPFASTPEVAVEPTDDVEALTAAIDGLEADGRTALYDAMILATELFEGRDGERSLVLFTDGGDNESTATLDDAVSAAANVEARVLNVALITSEQDPDVLEALAAGPGGQLLEVDELSDLEAAFEDVAESLTAGYVLRYDSDDLSDELDLTINVEHDGQQGRYQAVLLNPRAEPEEEALPELVPVAPSSGGVLGQPALLYPALIATFVALAIFLGFLLTPTAARATQRTLRRGMSAVPGGGLGPAQQPTTGATAAVVGQATIELVSKAPRPAGYDQRLQTDIDRAGWQLRASEFIALRVMGAFLGLAALWALSGSFLVGLLGLVVAAMLPALALSRAKTRRQDRFMLQLPDTLQLLAGSLKAGYGVLQAIDTIVREVDDPTSSEFQRALTEARLGLPLEVSLGDMAERIDRDDFRWVVVAMNIQRQVGGNLAELLQTVAATLRGREQVRRQIKTLSAEGRLSGFILTVLPFVLVGAVLFLSPGYLVPLFTTPIGLVLIGLAGGLMLLGVFWMRRMINIDI
jgi:tight adherence protein B